MTAIFGWLAGKLFFGGNKSALNLIPAIGIALVLATATYFAGRGMQAWKDGAKIKSLTTQVDDLTTDAAEKAAAYIQAVRDSEDRHTAALIERDRLHEADLQRRATEITEARERAAEATQRFQSLNNQLVRIQNATPAVVCPVAADRLQILDAAERAANGAGTGEATTPAGGGR